MANGLGPGKRGNYKGLIQKLDSLRELGVTSLEFLPIYEFEEIKYKFHYEMGENGAPLIRKTMEELEAMEDE